jgi:hypothetical protein
MGQDVKAAHRYRLQFSFDWSCPTVRMRSQPVKHRRPCTVVVRQLFSYTPMIGVGQLGREALGKRP